MSITDEATQTMAVEQAGEWYARHRDGELTSTEAEAFMAWMQASPLHVREYLAIANLTNRLPEAMDELNVDRQDLLERARHWLRTNGNVVPLHPLRAEAVVSKDSNRLPRMRGWLIAASILIAVGIGSALYWGWPPAGLNAWPRVVDVPRGEQRTVRLGDGSVLYLNADTRVRVRYSADRRLIELDRGQALFTVARNAARPFIVRAGATEVIAVGTQFDVSRQNAQGAVTVTVMEGRVDVFDPASASASTPRLRLAAGEQLRLPAASRHSRAEPVDLHVATAWLRRELIFSERPLGDVAEEFSRYGVPIEIEDAQLRDYRVSGVFSTYDTESFVRFLERFGAVEQSERGITVRGR